MHVFNIQGLQEFQHFLQTVTANNVMTEHNTIYSKNYHNMDWYLYPYVKLPVKQTHWNISKTQQQHMQRRYEQVQPCGKSQSVTTLQSSRWDPAWETVTQLLMHCTYKLTTLQHNACNENRCQQQQRHTANVRNAEDDRSW